MQEYVLSLNKKTQKNIEFPTFNCPQEVKVFFMTDQLNIIFWRFRYMITRLWNLVQLSI